MFTAFLLNCVTFKSYDYVFPGVLGTALLKGCLSKIHEKWQHPAHSSRKFLPSSFVISEEKFLRSFFTQHGTFSVLSSPPQKLPDRSVGLCQLPWKVLFTDHPGDWDNCISELICHATVGSIACGASGSTCAHSLLATYALYAFACAAYRSTVSDDHSAADVDCCGQQDNRDASSVPTPTT